ncbi:endopeptidase La [Ureaplasma urealyticum]|uniref:endopeptidase La n=1 Tax=Ureaplasma urealyticum TaxID=2130 RepID=UPI001F40C2FB|nr:endopeptidase La [Ureaplasma urealyticum]UIU15391.1 endopeptidase La [Ureaplasma urealyticum]
MKKPILISRAIVVLPYETTTIEVGRPKSIQAIDLAKQSSSKEIIVISQKNIDTDEVVNFDELYKVGTLVKIKSIVDNFDDGYSIEVEGIKAVYINSDSEVIDAIEYEYEDVITNPILSTKDEVAINEINSEIFNTINKRTKHKDIAFENMHALISLEKEKFAYLAAATYINDYDGEIKEKTIKDRINILLQPNLLLVHETILHFLFDQLVDKRVIEEEVEKMIADKINNNLQKQQREFFLREKLKVVKEQLGELSSREEDADKIRAKIEQLELPPNVRERALAELNRFESAMSSNESSVIKSYLDWLLDLPWTQQGVDNTDLMSVRTHLDDNHYGIEKVKERILEYLALRMRNPNLKGPIICLVGPPGVGKTSLVTSIAQALNKKFVKVSLGGVRDESEIRGHRKTYVGAMPGRIIKGMKKAGVVNPLFLLDEIDKMTSDQRGDPAAAMLEVLDPEQNKNFSDNYIEEEYDLSKVMFMATANYYQQIPYALIDRLEVIELSSYTAIEKREIAKSHLLKRIFADAKLNENELIFNDYALDFIINHYTKEAGVRELDRQLGHIVRKYIVETYKNKNNKSKPSVEVDEAVIIKYLGKIKFDFNKKEETTIPGIVNGMAYTAAGGDLLPIEVNHSTNGKGGNITITGNLEKTMNESVSVALGFVKANAEKYGIDTKKVSFKEIDIHVHVPSGGIPKDGPSAGIAITTAIISSLSQRPVRTTLSMTGEIMLRGNVGIIGGVKEKVISAYRAGVREIILPIDDERYLEDVPKYILDDIKIHLVKHYDEVYNIVFGTK